MDSLRSANLYKISTLQGICVTVQIILQLRETVARQEMRLKVLEKQVI